MKVDGSRKLQGLPRTHRTPTHPVRLQRGRWPPHRIHLPRQGRLPCRHELPQTSQTHGRWTGVILGQEEVTMIRHLLKAANGTARHILHTEVKRLTLTPIR
jgi:hypothetical protein